MEFTKLLQGSSGHVAQGFTRATLCSQNGFWLGRSVVRDASPARDIPVFDQSIVEAMGDNGLPTVQPLNTAVLVSGYAAAFLLLSSHIKTPHPETGRKEEHLLRFLKSPAMLLQDAFDYGLNRQIMQTKATAEMLKADPTARIEALKAEAQKRVESVIEPVTAAFVEALKGLRDKDTDELVDIACEALIDAGRDPASEIKNSAIKFIESQKKRLESGEFVSVDAGIYALAQ
jgi:hypothetical protein